PRSRAAWRGSVSQRQNGRGGGSGGSGSSAPQGGTGGSGGGGAEERGTGPAALSPAPPALRADEARASGRDGERRCVPPLPLCTPADRPTLPEALLRFPGDTPPPRLPRSPPPTRVPAGSLRRTRREPRDPSPPACPRIPLRARHTDCRVSPLPPPSVKDFAGSSSPDPLPALAPSCGSGCWILLPARIARGVPAEPRTLLPSQRHRWILLPRTSRRDPPPARSPICSSMWTENPSRHTHENSSRSTPNPGFSWVLLQHIKANLYLRHTRAKI
ncbi:hypothetical protein Nmel_016172, partial [Mimus melanotis]